MISREFLDRQIRRIEKQTVKCVFGDEIYSQYSNCGEQEFADIVTIVMKEHKYAGQFPVIGKFEDALVEVRNFSKQKIDEVKNKSQQEKYSSWIPATEREKIESRAFLDFITEVRAWYYFNVPVNFDGSWSELKPLTYKNWRELYIMADYDEWIISGRPSLPCPIFNFFFVNGEKFYKIQVSKKDDTITRYWIDTVKLLEELRSERKPDSAGKKAPLLKDKTWK